MSENYQWSFSKFETCNFLQNKTEKNFSGQGCLRDPGEIREKQGEAGGNKRKHEETGGNRKKQ